MESALSGPSKSVKTSAKLAAQRQRIPQESLLKWFFGRTAHQGLPQSVVKEFRGSDNKGEQGLPIFLIFPTVYSSVRLPEAAPTCLEQGLSLNW